MADAPPAINLPKLTRIMKIAPNAYLDSGIFIGLWSKLYAQSCIKTAPKPVSMIVAAHYVGAYCCPKSVASDAPTPCVAVVLEIANATLSDEVAPITRNIFILNSL